MARLAMDETVELTIRAQMFKELAQYVAPKRKALEMQADMNMAPPRFIIDLTAANK